MKFRKTTATLLIAIFMISAIILVVPAIAKKEGNTIQSGLIKASTGETLTVGFDEFGYNYQAHQYIGYYGNYQRPPELVDYGYRLMMKWNDAWLSNMDCDYDELLDRHYGYGSYVGSGAWLTNHQSGTYTVEETGEEYHWTYFVKIVAAPADAYTEGGVWFTEDGVEIGPVIWGSFAVIQEIYNDQDTGEHGIQYLSPSPVGFGYYNP